MRWQVDDQAVKAFGEDCKDDVSEASQERTLQAIAFLVTSMAVPVLTEKASDAVWSHLRTPEAGSQGVCFPG